MLAQLDAAAAKFSSAQTDFAWDQYTAVVQESDVQTGTIYFERKESVTRMTAELKLDNGKPAPRTVLYNGGQVKLYEPTIKQLTIMKAGANQRPVGEFSDPGVWW